MDLSDKDRIFVKSKLIEPRQSVGFFFLGTFFSFFGFWNLSLVFNISFNWT